MKSIVRRAMRPAYELARHLIREAAIEAAGDRESFSQQMQRDKVNQYQSFKMTGVLPYSVIRDWISSILSVRRRRNNSLRSFDYWKTRRVVEMCCGSAHEYMA